MDASKDTVAVPHFELHPDKPGVLIVSSRQVPAKFEKVSCRAEKIKSLVLFGASDDEICEEVRRTADWVKPDDSGQLVPA